ncbi:MAG TPA: cytochrome c oxidase subunit 3 [Gammaproteobacteria bacterium]|nr:cytochrome c oxidase subunit 3 [Gammaproteobacteria bacterium]
MFTLLFIMMLIAATVAWFVIQRLQDKPWLVQGVIASNHDRGGIFFSAPNVGLWSFLAVVASIFGIFTGAYYMRMDSSHGGVAMGVMEAWIPVGEPLLLWLNTAVLIVTSLCLEGARRAVTHEAIGKVRSALIAACVLTLVFVAGQVYAWQLVSPEVMTRSNAAYTFFVLLTAVHGLHLIGGLFVLTRAAARVSRDFDVDSKPAMAAIGQTVGLCATYWHFLLLVWAGIFALLLTS